MSLSIVNQPVTHSLQVAAKAAAAKTAKKPASKTKPASKAKPTSSRSRKVCSRLHLFQLQELTSSIFQVAA